MHSTPRCRLITWLTTKVNEAHLDGKDGYSRGSLVEGRYLVFLEKDGEILAKIDLEDLQDAALGNRILDHSNFVSRVELIRRAIDIASSSGVIYMLNDRGFIDRHLLILNHSQ